METSTAGGGAAACPGLHRGQAALPGGKCGVKAPCDPLLTRLMLSCLWGLQRALLLLQRGRHWRHGDVASSGCCKSWEHQPPPHLSACDRRSAGGLWLESASFHLKAGADIWEARAQGCWEWWRHGEGRGMCGEGGGSVGGWVSGTMAWWSPPQQPQMRWSWPR